jgi:hypothetical protein
MGTSLLHQNHEERARRRALTREELSLVVALGVEVDKWLQSRRTPPPPAWFPSCMSMRSTEEKHTGDER